MESFKVIIADDNIEFRKILKEKIELSGRFEVVYEANNGKEVFNGLDNVKADLLLLDVIMPELDGFEVLKQMKTFPEQKRPKVIVLTQLTGDAYIEKAISLGADYIMVKPINYESLIYKMNEILYNTNDFDNTNRYQTYNSMANRSRPINSNQPIQTYKMKNNHSLDEKISNIFISVGIPAHIKGYQFLREAIKLTIETPEIINCITKKLYPTIAEVYETSASKVERAIRHAIEVAWNRGRIENINNVFGIKVYDANDKPTNGEFIALVADKMIIEGA